MVPYALPAALARCGKDHFPEGSCLCAGTLRGQDGPAQWSLCEKLRYSRMLGARCSWYPPSLQDQCKVMGHRLWNPSSWVLLVLRTCSPSLLQPPAHPLGAERGTSLWQEKG